MGERTVLLAILQRHCFFPEIERNLDEDDFYKKNKNNNNCNIGSILTYNNTLSSRCVYDTQWHCRRRPAADTNDRPHTG